MPNLRQPTFFLSHGGGPWPWLMKETSMFDVLSEAMGKIVSQLPERPKAILVISGHWEESQLAVMASEHPRMIYDYGGFPEHTYHIQYPSPGAPELAVKVQSLLKKAGFQTQLDSQRGYDHGTYSVIYPLFPNADIPVIQLSMKSDYDPEEHLRIGRALAPLRDEGVLIVGSGSSYHNMRGFFGHVKSATEDSRDFDSWLQTAMASSPDDRWQQIANWKSDAPHARAVHPREDHLIPLMVAVGAAGNDKAILIYNELFMRTVMVSSFRFG
ncbi:MAG: class III extradiol ring-cleavage dioxygenase [Pseudobdellovibrionaceae bacterium]